MDDPEWSIPVIPIISLCAIALLTRLSSTGNALSRSTLERLAKEGVPRARLLLSFYRSRDFVDEMITYGQTVAIAMGAVTLLQSVPSPWSGSRLWAWMGLGLWVVLFVLLSLLVRNITPPYRREEGSDRPLPRLPVICYPLYILLVLPALLLQRAQHLFVSEDESKALKEEELRNIVESEVQEGTLEEEEREMIEGIFGFAETTVKEVMSPRIDMVCTELSSSLDDVLKSILESRHSRIPIYEERIDNIKGVVYAKDLLEPFSKGESCTIKNIMREPYFVPENKTLDELMTEFKTSRIHIAIVVGEYGGTSGLVTMEDILEEIVGEIQDEFDEEVPLFEWLEEDQVLIADARIDIEDLNELLHVELPQEGYETLGGFIYHQLGHVPNPDESLDFRNLTIRIKNVEGQRITTVRIEKREIDQNSELQSAEIA
ncbi:MAG: hemolysin family protein [bacterium]|nr:hemolysin family protein [bacterium]